MSDAAYWTILVLINIPVYIGVGRALFDDLEDFFECIRYSLMPDMISWLSGDLTKDWHAEMKLTAFVVVSGLVVFGEHWLINTYFV